MTPVEICLMVESEDDEYVSIAGAEGHVCLDAAAARQTGAALTRLADVMEDAA